MLQSYVILLLYRQNAIHVSILLSVILSCAETSIQNSTGLKNLIYHLRNITMELQATCKMRVPLICEDGITHLQQKEIILT